jgi:hypothetical protein
MVYYGYSMLVSLMAPESKSRDSFSAAFPLVSCLPFFPAPRSTHFGDWSLRLEREMHCSLPPALVFFTWAFWLRAKCFVLYELTCWRACMPPPFCGVHRMVRDEWNGMAFYHGGLVVRGDCCEIKKFKILASCLDVILLPHLLCCLSFCL